MKRSGRTSLGDIYETNPVNVFDIQNKKIVFTGSQKDAAVFLGVTPPRVRQAFIQKDRIKKKYAVRLVKTT